MRALLSCLPRTADDFGTLAALGVIFAFGYLILAL